MNEDTKSRLRMFREALRRQQQDEVREARVHQEYREAEYREALREALVGRQQQDTSRLESVIERMQAPIPQVDRTTRYNSVEGTDNFQTSIRVDYHPCEICGMRIKCQILHRVGKDRHGTHVDEYIYTPTETHVCRAPEKIKQDEINAQYVPVTTPEDEPDGRIKGLIERMDKE